MSELSPEQIAAELEIKIICHHSIGQKGCVGCLIGRFERMLSSTQKELDQYKKWIGDIAQALLNKPYGAYTFVPGTLASEVKDLRERYEGTQKELDATRDAAATRMTELAFKIDAATARAERAEAELKRLKQYEEMRDA